MELLNAYQVPRGTQIRLPADAVLKRSGTGWWGYYSAQADRSYRIEAQRDGSHRVVIFQGLARCCQ